MEDLNLSSVEIARKDSMFKEDDQLYNENTFLYIQFLPTIKDLRLLLAKYHDYHKFLKLRKALAFIFKAQIIYLTILTKSIIYKLIHIFVLVFNIIIFS